MKAIQTKTQLTYNLVSQASISGAQIDRMFRLMEANYDFIAKETFIADLSKKQWVGLLLDEDETIQGFTTFAVNPGGVGTDEYNIIFSGDTIVSPDSWGSLEFLKGVMHSGGQIVASDPDKKWYWLLISKGHRTYMYLPLFFHSYYPRADHADADTLFPILDKSCTKLFGDCWYPDKGLIIFPESLGQLKPELAASTWQKKKKPPVAFFLEKNPEFYMGHELACMTELKPDNFRGIAQNFFVKGMSEPVVYLG